jgi:hypothetical protein
MMRGALIGVVGIALVVAFFFFASGIGFEELVNWGTTKGLNICRQNAMIQSAQSGVSSAQEVLVTKCFDRHTSPIFANVSGQASFQQMPAFFNLPAGIPSFQGWFVNSTTDHVITEYQIFITPKSALPTQVADCRKPWLSCLQVCKGVGDCEKGCEASYNSCQTTGVWKEAPQQNASTQISHRFINSWVEPRQRTDFNFQVNQIYDVNAFTWAVQNIKGAKVAF